MRNVLGHVPVFNDFMLLVDAEDIDNRPRHARLATGDLNVQDHMIAVDKRLINFAVRVGLCVLQEGDKLLKACNAVFRHRVMLYVVVSQIGSGGGKVFVI